MCQLSYDYKGRRFVPPETARFWRVRRLREAQRGHFDVVLTEDGVPLVVPIDIGVKAFREAVGDRPGRYRLDALDDQELEIANVEPAYVTIRPQPVIDLAARSEAEDAGGEPSEIAVPGLRNAGFTTGPATVSAPFGVWPALPMPAAMSGAEYLLGEALRGQVQMFQALTTALAGQGAATASGASQMMNAAAELVRAADGAAMPRRPALPVSPPPAALSVAPSAATVAPRNARDGALELDDDDEVDDEQVDDDAEGDEAMVVASDADVMSKLMTLADKVQGVVAPVADVARMVVGGLGGRGLRNAADDASEDDEDDEGDEPDPEVASPLPAHLRTSHMIAIGYELGRDGSRFRRIVAAMEPADRQALTDHLCSMSLEDAVADVAAKLARITGSHACAHARAASMNGEPAVSPMPVVVIDPVGVVLDEIDEHAGSEIEVAGADEHAEVREADYVLAGASTHDLSGGHDRDEGDGAGTGEPTSEPVPATDHEPTAALDVPPRAASAPPADGQALMLEIARHLSMAEILRVQRLAASLSATDRAAWLARLSSMPPKRAAKVIRRELAKQ